MKVPVEWTGPEVHLQAEDRTLKPGDRLEMDEAEAKDRQEAGQVKIITRKAGKGE